MRTGHKTLLALGGLICLSGCATGTGPLLADLERVETSVELTETPFYPQITDQCGPAALATVLNVADVDTDAQRLRPLVHIPERRGSLQLEMLAATRSFGRVPYEIDPTPVAILDELDAGRPVVILQNLGTGFTPIWHYAVVVGYLHDEEQFVLRSGDRERHVVSNRRLLKTWERADFWGFVVLRPGEFPARAEPRRYLKSVAAIESIGDTDTAHACYAAAAARWPGNALAWLGLGNTALDTGEYMAAKNAFSQAVAVDPDNVIALNNLSHTYAEMGCNEDALAIIERALSMVDAEDPLTPHLRQTLAGIPGNSDSSACVSETGWE